MKGFAEATGGLQFSLQSDQEKEIRKVAGRLVEEIRYQYYIGISCSSAGEARATPSLHVFHHANGRKIKSFKTIWEKTLREFGWEGKPFTGSDVQPA